MTREEPTPDYGPDKRAQRRGKSRVVAVVVLVGFGLAGLSLAAAVLYGGLTGQFKATGDTATVAARTSPTNADDHGLSFRAAANGHFYIRPHLNNVPTRLMVDTGATITVISRRDARRIDINLDALDYTIRVRTASGVVRAARVTLREFRLGPVELYDLPVLVLDAPTGISVLGLDTLRLFKGYAVRDNVLTLYR